MYIVIFKGHGPQSWMFPALATDFRKFSNLTSLKSPQPHERETKQSNFLRPRSGRLPQNHMIKGCVFSANCFAT